MARGTTKTRTRLFTINFKTSEPRQFDHVYSLVSSGPGAAKDNNLIILNYLNKSGSAISRRTLAVVPNLDNKCKIASH